jgi:hypothetical protein
MNQEQIQILWSAAKQSGLTPEQLRGLTIANPFTLSGPVADRMKAAVSSIAPAQAQAWIAEAGASMSLQAKAAQLGLAEMTYDLQAEIEAFSPMTPEQAREARIDQLSALQPYGTQGQYDAQGNYIPGAAGNLTAAVELEALAPDVAAALKAKAQPAAPQPGALDEAGALFVNQFLATGGRTPGAQGQ